VPVINLFKAPAPYEGERHDDYLRRLVAAFEQWTLQLLEKAGHIPGPPR
jgi:hypothetical protein